MFPRFPFHSHHMLHPYPPIPPDSPPDIRTFYPYTPNEVKHRKRTTSSQLRTLEGVFRRDTKPNAALRNKLAEELKMTPRGVQVWFQNRRAKEKSKANKAKTAAEAAKQAVSPNATASGLPGSSTSSPKSSVANYQPPLDQRPQGEQPQEVPISAQPSMSHPQQSSITPSIITPPRLPVFATPDFSNWEQQYQIAPNDDVLTSLQSDGLSAAELYATRRGSLPARAFPHEPISPSPPDALIAQRRGSIDANFHRAMSNSYGIFTRSRTDGAAGVRGQRMLAIRSPPLTRSSGYSNPRPSFYPHPQHTGIRRASMDSRAMFLSQREIASPSQPPLSAYSGARASLPIPNSLYTIPSRTISPPGPGPLPAPNFQFGAASTAGLNSSSPGESERNSPDSPHSFTYREDERDDDNASVGSYIPNSRFGSFQSIATSESGSLYSDFTNLTSAMPSPVIMSGRRPSCTPAFVGLMSSLGVNDASPNVMPESAIENTYPHDEPREYTDTCPPVNPIFDYSPSASTISTGDVACAQDSLSAANFTFSRSSELAHALENQPQQTELSKMDHHMTPGPHASHPSSVDCGAFQQDDSYYISENEVARSDVSPTNIFGQTSPKLTTPESSHNVSCAPNYLLSDNVNDGFQILMDYTQCTPSTNIYSNYGDSPFPSSAFPSFGSSPKPEQCAPFT